MKTNVGNLRITRDRGVVRFSMHVPHPTVLDCLLTDSEVLTLIETLQRAVAPPSKRKRDDDLI